MRYPHSSTVPRQKRGPKRYGRDFWIQAWVVLAVFVAFYVFNLSTPRRAESTIDSTFSHNSDFDGNLRQQEHQTQQQKVTGVVEDTGSHPPPFSTSSDKNSNKQDLGISNDQHAPPLVELNASSQQLAHSNTSQLTKSTHQDASQGRTQSAKTSRGQPQEPRKKENGTNPLRAGNLSNEHRSLGGGSSLSDLVKGVEAGNVVPLPPLPPPATAPSPTATNPQLLSRFKDLEPAFAKYLKAHANGKARAECLFAHVPPDTRGLRQLRVKAVMDAARDDVTFCAGATEDPGCPRDTRVPTRGNVEVESAGSIHGGWREIVANVAAAAASESDGPAECSFQDAQVALAEAMLQGVVTRVTGLHVRATLNSAVWHAPYALLASGRLLSLTAKVPNDDPMVRMEAADVDADVALVCEAVRTQSPQVLEGLELSDLWAGALAAFHGSDAGQMLEQALRTCEAVVQESAASGETDDDSTLQVTEQHKHRNVMWLSQGQKARAYPRSLSPSHRISMDFRASAQRTLQSTDTSEDLRQQGSRLFTLATLALALRSAALPHATVRYPIPTAARNAAFQKTAKNLTSDFAHLGVNRGEAKAYGQGPELVLQLFDLPVELQRRVIKVVDAGFFVRQSMGWQGLLMGAAQAYEFGQRSAFPEVFMIGPPKTSTTSFYECMGAAYHQKWVCKDGLCDKDPASKYFRYSGHWEKDPIMAKEPKIFMRWDLREKMDSPAIYNRLPLFPPLPGHPVMVDASVSYITTWHPPMLVYFAAPDPSRLRIIVIFRDPVDTLYSHYSMSKSRGAIKTSLEQYAKSEAQRLDTCYQRLLRSSAAWREATRLYPNPADKPVLGVGPLGKAEAVSKLPFDVFHTMMRTCPKLVEDRLTYSMYDYGMRLWLQMFDREQFGLISYADANKGGLEYKLRMIARLTGLTVNEGMVKELVAAEGRLGGGRRFDDDALEEKVLLGVPLNANEAAYLCTRGKFMSFSNHSDKESAAATLELLRAKWKEHTRVAEELTGVKIE